MKRSAVFILILLISILKPAKGCSYYPYGEDVRFHLLNPESFGYKDFAPFYYTANMFSPAQELINARYNRDSLESSKRMNIELWRKRCKCAVSEKDVYDAVYLDSFLMNDPDCKNKFIQYLHKNNDVEAIKYLDFAKNISMFNSFFEDPWERYQTATLPQRTAFIATGLKKVNDLKDEDIKLRYAFLIIRLCYYNSDFETIKKLYNENFGNREEKNIIDYWSMYFFALTEPKGALRNYHAAMVFTYAPDKRFMVEQVYCKKISVSETLRHAKNKKEIAAVWLLAGIDNPARALECIKNIYINDPHSDGLSFLLLREVNKLEDWIYTPYYTYFEPSVSPENYNVYSKNHQRILRDKAYAQEVLSFVNSINCKLIESPKVLEITNAYLLLMTEKHSASLAKLNAINNELNEGNTLNEDINILKAVCLTAQQTNGSAIIFDEIKPLLMQQCRLNNYRFIFAIARELEFKGNTTDAALLFSKINVGQYEENSLSWKSRHHHITSWDDYYTNYFYYMDAEYTTNEMVQLITDVEKSKDKDVFSSWKYSMLKNDLPRMYDLLGTKYLRENDLINALSSYEKVNDTLWKSKYFSYKTYLNANPFYTDFYNEHNKTAADTINYNKASITRALIKYINRGDDINEKDRDYYFFLAANCYLNMTQYGNSWMMKRYYWSSSAVKSNLPDDKDYMNCDRAKLYYLKAKSLSKNKKFAAICLRLSGRCEKYRLVNELRDKFPNLEWEKFSEKVFKANKYYSQIKTQYPDYYEDLISNCFSFEDYMKTRVQ